MINRRNENRKPLENKLPSFPSLNNLFQRAQISVWKFRNNSFKSLWRESMMCEGLCPEASYNFYKNQAKFILLRSILLLLNFNSEILQGQGTAFQLLFCAYFYLSFIDYYSFSIRNSPTESVISENSNWQDQGRGPMVAQRVFLFLKIP